MAPQEETRYHRQMYTMQRRQTGDPVPLSLCVQEIQAAKAENGQSTQALQEEPQEDIC